MADAGEGPDISSSASRPTFGQARQLALPVKVGLSLGDYYELRGDERFGFFSVAAS